MGPTRKAKEPTTKSKTKTKPLSKYGPKKIRVINKNKEDAKNKRRQQAVEGRCKAREKLEDTKKRIAEMKAEKAKLEENARGADSDEDAAAARAQIVELEKRIQQDDTEMRDVEAEEERFDQEVKDADMIDVTEEQEVNDVTEGSSEQRQSEKPSDDDNESDNDDSGDESNDSGDKDNDTDEEEHIYPDLINKDEMKKGLGLTSGICIGWMKVGREGKRPIIQVGPNSSPCFRTQKASQFDGIIPGSNKFNLVKHRRVDVRNKDDTLKFTMDDVVGIQGVSWYVPNDYEGNLTEMLKPLPPKLTKQQKETMKASGEAIPEAQKPVTVQVLIK